MPVSNQQRDTVIHRFFHKKESTTDYLALRVKELNSQLKHSDPDRLAANTGAIFNSSGQGQGEFRLTLWDRQVGLSFPDFKGRDLDTDVALDTFSMAFLAYYFNICDGTPETGSWISFSELPDGKFYTQAFQGYTGNKLAKSFGNDKDAFEKAALKLNGRRETMGDAAFSFRALPHVALLVVCWLGDEDFPPSYRVLFDSAASHHLSTDAFAILGSTLSRRLIKSHL